MKIRFESSGDIAGSHLRFTAEVDTASRQLIYGAKKLQKQLTEDEAKDLENTVNSSGFFSLPARLTGTVRMRMPTTFSITVEDGSKRHTVSGQREGIPDQLEPLFEKLLRLSKGM
jgi:Emfourin